MPQPKLLLQIEGAAVLAASCVFYHEVEGDWRWFALLFLVPDLSMLGYLANKRNARSARMPADTVGTCARRA